LSLISKILKEAKQRGELYHFTSLYNAKQIIHDNFIACHYEKFKNSGLSIKGFSLTRDKNIFKSPTLFMSIPEVGLIFNGEKISQNFRIIPYNYFSFQTRKIGENEHNEFEEKVVLKNERDFKVDNYLIGMIFNNKNIFNKEKINRKEELIKYCNEKGLKVIEVGNSPINEKIKLKEAKQIGPLYHFTDVESSINILNENKMFAHSFHLNKKEYEGISFTRNKNFYKNEPMITSRPQIGLIFDGAKISQKFRVLPFNFFSRKARYISDLHNYNEFEEKVIVPSGKEFVVSDYLIGIFITNFKDWDRNEDEIKELIDLVKSKGLKIIQEGKLKEEKDYGKYLFAQNKKIADLQNGEFEKNTDEEQIDYKKIRKFVSDPNKKNKKNLQDVIYDLIPLEDKFPEILKPNEEFVYRGTYSDINTIFNFNFITTKERIKLGNSDYCLVFKNFKYSVHDGTNISSWTSDVSIAKDFANEISNYGDNKFIPIILKAKINEKFIFSDNFMNILSNDILEIKEYEVICFSEEIECEVYIKEEDIEKIEKFKKQDKRNSKGTEIFE